VLAVRTVETVSAPRRFVWSASLTDGMASFWIREGDTGRPLAVLFKNLDGSDVMVPSGTTCVFTMVDQDTGHTVSGAATLADDPNVPGTNNMATYPFSNPADTAHPGLYDATWVLTYPGGATETFPTSSLGTNSFVIEVVPRR
jgi:hypothetical protein